MGSIGLQHLWGGRQNASRASRNGLSVSLNAPSVPRNRPAVLKPRPAVPRRDPTGSRHGRPVSRTIGSFPSTAGPFRSATRTFRSTSFGSTERTNCSFRPTARTLDLAGGASVKWRRSKERWLDRTTYEKHTNHALFHTFLPINCLVPGIQVATGGRSA